MRALASSGNPAHHVTIRIAALMVGFMLTSTTYADLLILALKDFELTREEQLALEAAACHPLGLKMHAAQASGFENSTRWFSASVRCASRAKIDGHPVFIDRYCGYELGAQYDAGLSCHGDLETLSTTYSDRRIDINAEGLSLTEAYRVVSYFVGNASLEPGDVKDVFDDDKTLPFDECVVRAVTGNELELACTQQHRSVERIISNGVVSYRDISRR